MTNEEALKGLSKGIRKYKDALKEVVEKDLFREESTEKGKREMEKQSRALNKIIKELKEIYDISDGDIENAE